jgi:hypothetical protein
MICCCAAPKESRKEKTENYSKTPSQQRATDTRNTAETGSLQREEMFAEAGSDYPTTNYHATGNSDSSVYPSASSAGLAMSESESNSVPSDTQSEVVQTAPPAPAVHVVLIRGRRPRRKRQPTNGRWRSTHQATTKKITSRTKFAPNLLHQTHKKGVSASLLRN